MKTALSHYKRVILGVVIAPLLAIFGLLAWQWSHPPPVLTPVPGMNGCYLSSKPIQTGLCIRYSGLVKDSLGSSMAAFVVSNSTSQRIEIASVRMGFKVNGVWTNNSAGPGTSAQHSSFLAAHQTLVAKKWRPVEAEAFRLECEVLIRHHSRPWMNWLYGKSFQFARFWYSIPRWLQPSSITILTLTQSEPVEVSNP